jgi:hypothetical protein
MNWIPGRQVTSSVRNNMYNVAGGGHEAVVTVVGWEIEP